MLFQNIRIRREKKKKREKKKMAVNTCRFKSGPKRGQFKKQSRCAAEAAVRANVRRQRKAKAKSPKRTIRIRRGSPPPGVEAAVACQRREQAKENLELAEQVADQQGLDVNGFYDIARLGSVMRNFFPMKVTLRQAVRAFATAGSRVGLLKTMADDVSADDYCRVQVFLLVLVINALVAEFGGPGGPLSGLRRSGLDPINRMPDLSGCSGLGKSEVAAFWSDKWRSLLAASRRSDSDIAAALMSLALEFTVPNSGRAVLEPENSPLKAVIEKTIRESDGSDDAKLLTFILDQMAGPDGLPAGSQEQAQAGSVGLRLLKGLLIGGAVAGAGYAASQYMAPGGAQFPGFPGEPLMLPSGDPAPKMLPTSGFNEQVSRERWTERSPYDLRPALRDPISISDTLQSPIDAKPKPSIFSREYWFG